MILTGKAILFDLDGVLVDSTPAVERVWRRWAAAHNVDPEYVVSMAHGRRSVETIRVVAPEMKAEEENLKVEQMEIDDKEGIVVIPGAPELLRSLPPERFTIVTSATPALAVARLGYAELPVPKRFVSADDVVNGKPDPEPYLKGAALLGFAAKDCIVIEDVPAGVQSAKAAGMRAIALTTTYPAAELTAADAILSSCRDIKASFDGTELRLELRSLAAGVPR
ncbi:MAG TPA: HAD family hydrolase [Terriglobales bacterium]